MKDEATAEYFVRNGIYVNWVDKLVLVGKKALPFRLHAYDKKTKEFIDAPDKKTKNFHAALESVGFCPLCGKTIKQKKWQ